MTNNVTKIKEDDQTDRTKLPARDDLFALRRVCAELDETFERARSEKSAALKAADNDKNIHKGAFKIISNVLNMSADKQDSFLTHFDHYRAVFGLDEGRTGDLFESDRVAAE